MLKLYLISLLTLLLSAFGVRAQIVTTSPSPLTEDSKNVVIYYHADQGNRGLAGLPSTAEVYAHTGVGVINASGQAETWKNAPAWNTNLPKYRMTYVSPNLWKLEIGDIRTFYGIPTSDKILNLAFVFRTGDRTKEGKTADGKDIFVNVEGSALKPSEPSELKEVPAMGAHRGANGAITFCIAAPGKKSVTLLGSWNNFQVTDNQIMKYIDSDVNGVEARYFTVTLPESTVAHNTTYLYYYMIDGTVNTGDPYARLILDSDNDKDLNSEVFPNLPAYPTGIPEHIPLAVYNDNLLDYTWKTTNFKGASKENLIIYELLFRDFTGTEGKAYGNGTVRKAIEKIPYLKSLGVNAVELLPISEFSGNNSWGYNPNFYFAPDKAYGTPQDYKEFIDLCHAEGIAVILDVVFNQADGLHPWYQMYEPGENPFFNKVAPHAYSVFNDWNQGYALVQKQWKDVLQYWLEEFNVDGFRFDLVKGLGDNNSYASATDAATNAYNASRVARMKQLHAWVKEVKPEAYFINEDLAGEKEENEMGEDGELNWVNANYAGCQFAMGYQEKSDLNITWAPGYNRLPGSTVSYLESHDEERLAYKANKWGVTGVKDNHKAVCQRLGSAAAQLLLVPGTHMIWMFSEMGNAESTKKNDTGDNNVDPKIVDWALLDDPDNKGLWDSYKELIGIRLGNKDLFSESANFTMNCRQSDWTSGRSIIASTSDKELYVYINPKTDTPLSVTAPFRFADNSRYHILSKSYDSSPTFDAVTKNVTVPANCYVVITSKNVSEVKGVAGDRTGFNVSSGDGSLTVSGASAPVSVWSVAGDRIHESDSRDFTLSVERGVYIVRSGKESVKVMVK